MRVRKEVQGIIFNEKRNKVLLIKKLDRKFRNYYWRLVKGGIEEGETEEEALKREIFEEIGLTRIKILKKIHEYEYYFPNDLIHHVSVYAVEGDSQEKLDLKGDDNSPITESRWVDPEKAEKILEYEEERNGLRLAVKEII